MNDFASSTAGVVAVVNAQHAAGVVAASAGQAVAIGVADDPVSGSKFQPLTYPPPIYSGVVGSEEKPLQADIDARRWAAEFMLAKRFIEERGEKIDDGTMIAWFANAIMCGIEEQGRRYAKAAADSAAEIRRLEKAVLEAVARGSAHDTECQSLVTMVLEARAKIRWKFIWGALAGAAFTVFVFLTQR